MCNLNEVYLDGISIEYLNGVALSFLLKQRFMDISCEKNYFNDQQYFLMTNVSNKYTDLRSRTAGFSE